MRLTLHPRAAGALAVAAMLSVGCGARAADLLGLRGLDPVSYRLDGGPIPGSERFELSWGRQVWRFASAADRAAFAADPEIYAPRLGGNDAVGASEGRIVDADPTLFALVGDRLYLFRDARRRARFLAEPDLAGAAEAAWPGLAGLLDTPPDRTSSPEDRK